MSNTEIKATAMDVAIRIVGAVEWLNDNEGLCECPGKSMHSSRNGTRDCKIYLDGVPTLACFHSGCKTVVEAKSKELRNALRGGKPDDRQRTGLSIEEKKRLAEIQSRENIRRRAAQTRTIILKKYAWPYQQMLTHSPTPVSENIPDHWRLLLSRFKSGDMIWIGDKFDSGKQEHASHFKTIEQWSAGDSVPGPFVCPVNFKNNSISRSNENVIERRFLVVESDTLSRDEVGAVFRWLRDEVELPLVAIVDTAGKSLHAWFEYPPEHLIDELKLILPELGCDPALFKASQPVRLPGVMRGDRPQKLVYLAKEVSR